MIEWYRPVTFYRYNENGRESGWVRINDKYVARVWPVNKMGLREAAWHRADDGTPCGGHTITPEDLQQYFELKPAPEWAPRYARYERKRG